jgi:hypothetical protein
MLESMQAPHWDLETIRTDHGNLTQLASQNDRLNSLVPLQSDVWKLEGSSPLEGPQGQGSSFGDES